MHWNDPIAVEARRREAYFRCVAELRSTPRDEYASGRRAFEASGSSRAWSDLNAAEKVDWIKHDRRERGDVALAAAHARSKPEDYARARQLCAAHPKHGLLGFDFAWSLTRARFLEAAIAERTKRNRQEQREDGTEKEPPRVQPRGPADRRNDRGNTGRP